MSDEPDEIWRCAALPETLRAYARVLHRCRQSPPRMTGGVDE
ncbi:MAG: hypothetical protein ACR2J8_12005 [Thermomicrobiales bacterium]